MWLFCVNKKYFITMRFTWNLVKGLTVFNLVAIALTLSASMLLVQTSVVAQTQSDDTPAASTPINRPDEAIPETEPASDEIHLVVKLRAKRVYVYRGLEIIATYPIAVGKPGWETPKGTYRVYEQEQNPIFKSFKTGRIINPGPENPLGPRWIGIWTDGKTRLGFHGTNQPELIGKAVSHGCIRMRNQDVMALYDKVKVGTIVEVEP
jgi:L,D-transpeptidase ErfK/SrfK